MIRSEEITAISPEIVEQLTPHSRAQLNKAMDRNLAKDQVYAVYDGEKLLMVLGLKKEGMMAPAQIWVLLTATFGPRYAKLAKQVVRSFIRRYGGLYTAINVAHNPACRFAEFFGFRPRGPVVDCDGDKYQLYEVYS